MERDLSRWTWHRKARAWRSVDIHPVGISKWIADEARSSALFGNRDVRVIENAIDVSYWHRVSKDAARESFGLPHHKRVILFIALNFDERHKGFVEFREAVRLLAEGHDDYHALVIGAGPANGDRALGITATFTGRLDDDLAVRDAYSVADVTVLPSSAEAFGKAAAESLACGTPCVVFDGTGLADVVSHQQSGYVARQGDVAALAAGIEWVLESPDRWLHLSRAGRDAATRRFSVATQARAYVDLYTEIAGLRGRQEAG